VRHFSAVAPVARQFATASRVYSNYFFMPLMERSETVIKKIGTIFFLEAKNYIPHNFTTFAMEKLAKVIQEIKGELLLVPNSFLSIKIRIER
jgi:hypothetical protein